MCLNLDSPRGTGGTFQDSAEACAALLARVLSAREELSPDVPLLVRLLSGARPRCGLASTHHIAAERTVSHAMK